MNNCSYDKIKILHKLSKIVFFIDQFALKDSKDLSECNKIYLEIKQNLEKDMEKLKKVIDTHKF